VVAEYEDEGVKIGVSHLDVDDAENADYADDAGDDSAIVVIDAKYAKQDV